jgi:hypothetical protein
LSGKLILILLFGFIFVADGALAQGTVEKALECGRFAAGESTSAPKLLRNTGRCGHLPCMDTVHPAFSTRPQDGNTIDSIVIDNNNIYNTDSSAYNYWPFRLINKLHLKTRRFVIEREILLKRGEEFSPERAAESERNLRSLPYIWAASVDFRRNRSNQGILYVTTSDRWTLLGGVSINRSGGRNIYEFRIEESNFLGRGQYVSFNYFSRNQEEDYYQFAAVERRVFGSRNMLSFYVNSDPEIGQENIGLSRPFYSFDSKLSYLINHAKINRYDYYYKDGILMAQNKAYGEIYELESVYRWGGYASKAFAGVEYQFRKLDFFSEQGDGFVFPTDSSYYGINLKFGLVNEKYIKATHLNSFQRIEDVLIQTGGVLTHGWYSDHNSRKLYDLLSFVFNYSNSVGSNLFFATFGRKYWYDGNIDFRKQLILSIKYYNNAYVWMTQAFYAVYQEDWRRDNNELLYLGESFGIRGYPKNYLNGGKILRSNWETRFFPGIRIMGVDIGMAQFIDIGQIAAQNRDIADGRFLWSAGCGLRIGTERIASKDILRIDLAYAGRLKKWEISIGSGQFIR